MGKKKNNYPYALAYGGNDLGHVKLPDKLQCVRCNKWRSQANFSGKQLYDAKTVVNKRGPNATFNIKCRTCTGGPILEIECFMCHETKGLEEFAKAQRAKPDHAKCMACVEKQLELDPVLDDRYVDPREAYEQGDYVSGPYPDYWDPSTTAITTTEQSQTDADEGVDDAADSGGGISLHDSLDKLTLTDVSNSNLSSRVDPYAAVGAQNGTETDADGWTVAGKSGHRKQTSGSAAGINPIFNGFNPNKYGHPGSRSGSTFNSNTTQRTEVKKGGWAKIRAFKPEPKPHADEQEDWKSDTGGGDESDTDSERSL